MVFKFSLYYSGSGFISIGYVIMVFFNMFVVDRVVLLLEGIEDVQNVLEDGVQSFVQEVEEEEGFVLEIELLGDSDILQVDEV